MSINGCYGDKAEKISLYLINRLKNSYEAAPVLTSTDHWEPLQSTVAGTHWEGKIFLWVLCIFEMCFTAFSVSVLCLQSVSVSPSVSVCLRVSLSPKPSFLDLFHRFIFFLSAGMKEVEELWLGLLAF